MSTEVRQENKMGTMPVGKLLFTMSTPMMISMLVQALYNIVDSIFVAMIEEDALTAVSLAFPIQNLMIAFATGTAVGMNALVSRHLGEKDFKRANQVAVNGIWLMFFTAILFCVGISATTGSFYRLLTDDAKIIAYGTTYLHIIGWLCFGLFFQMTFEKLLQSTGKTFYSMISQVTGALINVIMDPLLIFGVGPFPKMGVAGAAVATIFGQVISTVIGVYFNYAHNKELHLSFREYKLNRDIVGSIYAIGAPSIVMVAIGSVMNFFFNKILLVFSSTAAAVFGVYFKLQSFIFMPIFGMNNGMIPIVAYNYGAGKPDRIKRVIFLAGRTAVLIMAVGTFLFMVFPEFFLGLFSASADMMAMGVVALRIISVHFVIAGVSIICSSSLQALGHGFFSMVMSLVRQLIVLLPAAYVLAQLGGVNMVWWAFPIAEVVSLTLALIFLRRVMRAEIDPLYLQQAAEEV
ncbi:MAG: MATE family efflux transporter [Lachnospiraceae bacterium]|nr:MATE family efflux transporter [Lachnospiraceae bacterium]